MSRKLTLYNRLNEEFRYESKGAKFIELLDGYLSSKEEEKDLFKAAAKFGCKDSSTMFRMLDESSDRTRAYKLSIIEFVNDIFIISKAIQENKPTQSELKKIREKLESLTSADEIKK